MVDFKPSTVVIGLLVFTIIIVGMFMFVGDMSEKYGVEDSSAFKDTFDKSAELLELANDTGKQVSESGTPQSSWSSLFSLGGWKAMVKILTTVPSIFDSIFRGIAEAFSIPIIFIRIVMGIITIGIAAALIGAIFGRRV